MEYIIIHIIIYKIENYWILIIQIFWQLGVC